MIKKQVFAIGLLLLASACRFPAYSPQKLRDKADDIEKAANYILHNRIMNVVADTVSDHKLKQMLKDIKADRAEIIYKEKREFTKPDEPLDSLVVFTRIRKAHSLMWGAEEIIFQFRKTKGTYPDYDEADGYVFRKVNDRIFYRRYYFRET